MRYLNNPLIAAIVLAGFLWLGWTTYERDKADEIGYPDASIEKLNRMSAGKTNTLQELFHVSDEEISQPVILWRN